MKNLRQLAQATAVGLGAALALLVVAYVRDMRRAYRRVSGRSDLFPFADGDIEYSRGGVGPPVLVIHGSGGGFDQGQLIAETVLGDRFHWIAPSRFGYLRSTFRNGATFDDQAHAYAALLDHIGVEKVAVVALSHGGPSALLFALLHPERVSSLTLISAGVAPARTGQQGEADRKGNALAIIYQNDWLYWLITRLFRKQFLGLMGAREEVITRLTPAQREVVARVVDEMNPVAPRSAGVAFDNQAALPGARIAAIQAPTLIVHATDDTLQLFHNAEFAVATIPAARLLRFEHGGHLLMAVEQPAVRAAVQQHILEHAPGGGG